MAVFRSFYHIFYMALVALVLCLSETNAFASCASDEIDTVDGCKSAKFTITTKSDTSNFLFSINPFGTFYVDWGDGNVEKIYRGSDVAGLMKWQVVSHTYQTSGSYNIRFGGEATEYPNCTSNMKNSTDTTLVSSGLTGYNGCLGGYKGTIRFHEYYYEIYQATTSSGPQYYERYSIRNSAISATKIASMSGSLGEIFPTLNNGSSQPSFKETFKYATQITSLPTDGNGNSTLFSHVSGTPIPEMFTYTFSNCYALRSLPPGLFSGITGAAQSMFSYTFANCRALQSLPTDLFSGATGAANNMFESTFLGCTALQNLPTDSNGNSTLFNNVSGGAQSMFFRTFENCTNLTSLPSGLFSGVNSAASYMFYWTFYKCSNLQSLPQDANGDSTLFGNFNGGAERMFDGTFEECSNLTSLPSGLFTGVNSAAPSMFRRTFYKCSKLQSLSQDSNGNATLFGNFNGSAAGMFSETFSSCTSLQSLPNGLFDGITSASSSLFSQTFLGSGLRNIPTDANGRSTLFRNLVGSAANMFNYTFYNTRLTSIPYDLFAGVNGANYGMFNNTFAYC